jgi:hypothetical protein
MILFSTTYTPFNDYVIFEESEWNERPRSNHYLRCDFEKIPMELSFLDSNGEPCNYKRDHLELKEISIFSNEPIQLALKINDSRRKIEEIIIVDLFKYKPPPPPIGDMSDFNDSEIMVIDLIHTISEFMFNAWKLGSVEAWRIKQEKGKLKIQIEQLKTENDELRKSLKGIIEKKEKIMRILKKIK